VAPALVGRDAAVDVLTAAVDRLLAGTGGAAIVSGEAGIGKSELVAAVRRYAAAHGAAVAVGRCHEADLAPAFWPWLPVLRQLTGQLTGQLAAADVPKEIGRLLDAGQDAPEPGGAAVLRTYDAMARLVADAGRHQPLLLVIEAGAVATAGWDREVRLTGEAAKALKKAICESYIYPPVNDADALMAEAGRRPHPAVLV
jgi:hypothetical protein